MPTALYARGADFEDPAWFLAQQRDALPANIAVQEFYLASGALLGSRQAQQHYASLNYTHAAHGIAARGGGSRCPATPTRPHRRSHR